MALATSVGLALGTGTIKTEGGNVIISAGETGSVFVRKGSSIAPIIKDLFDTVSTSELSTVTASVDVAIGSFRDEFGDASLAQNQRHNATAVLLSTMSSQIVQRHNATAVLLSTMSSQIVSAASQIAALQSQAITTNQKLDRVAVCNAKNLVLDSATNTCVSPSLSAVATSQPCTNATLGAMRFNATSMDLSYCERTAPTNFSYRSVSASPPPPPNALRGDGTAASPYSRGADQLANCKAYRLAVPEAPTGVYWVRYANGNILRTFCEMDTAGGGWNLILVLGHGNNQYGGTTSPFIHDLNPQNPVPTSPYSRDWRNRINPARGGMFLLKRRNGDWVRFVQTYTWCGWNNRGGCHGVSSHLQFTRGQLFDSAGRGPLRERNGRNRLMERFNGCAYDGNCGSGNGDGVGFGSGPSWSHGPGTYGDVYGAGYNGRGRGGSSMYWGTGSEDGSLPYAYYWRP
jgi:hypothetical protein